MLLDIKIKIKYIDTNKNWRRYISDWKNIIFLRERETEMLIRWEEVTCQFTEKYDYNWKTYHEGRLKVKEENEEYNEKFNELHEKIKILEEQNQFLNEKMNQILKKI